MGFDVLFFKSRWKISYFIEQEEEKDPDELEEEKDIENNEILQEITTVKIFLF